MLNQRTTIKSTCSNTRNLRLIGRCGSKKRTSRQVRCAGRIVPPPLVPISIHGIVQEMYRSCVTVFSICVIHILLVPICPASCNCATTSTSGVHEPSLARLGVRAGRIEQFFWRAGPKFIIGEPSRIEGGILASRAEPELESFFGEPSRVGKI
jgi:hypothetical protein